MRDVPMVVAFATAIILSIVSMIIGEFKGIVFFGIVFYTIVWSLSRAYLKRSFEEEEERKTREENNKYKIDYCFNRVNEILVNRMGLSNLTLGDGVNRKSQRRDFFDGVQYKPFRSFEAKLKSSSSFVIVIYDIHDDDIAEFDSKPSNEKFNDHFKEFNPFKRGGMQSPDGNFSRNRRSRRTRKSKPRINIGFEDYDDEEEDFETSYGVDPATIDKAARDIGGGDKS